MRIYPTRKIGVAPCSIEGCGKVVFARGWCARHYTRWTRHGDPLAGRPDSLEERFWSKVRRGTKFECWEWQAARNDDGYGLCRGGSRSIEGAHRVSWRLANGEIPEGQQILHRCDNRACVNPAHLFLGSQQDNIADMLAKGRHVKRGKKAQAA
jgi:hypothetical protein